MRLALALNLSVARSAPRHAPRHAIASRTRQFLCKARLFAFYFSCASFLSLFLFFFFFYFYFRSPSLECRQPGQLHSISSNSSSPMPANACSSFSFWILFIYFRKRALEDFLSILERQQQTPNGAALS